MYKVMMTIAFLVVSLGVNAKGNGNDSPGNNVWAQLEALQAQVNALTGVPSAITVDCDGGESITDALTTPGSSLDIAYSGTCNEDVEIDRDDVTLTGDAGAQINGTVQVSSGRTAMLNNVSIANSSMAGLGMAQGATVTAVGLSVSGAGTSGIVNFGGSLVCVDCESSNNEVDGIYVGNAGRVLLAGSGTFNNNGQEGIEVGDSSSLVGDTLPSRLGATGDSNQIEANGNGATGVLVYGGSNIRFDVDDSITVAQNPNGILGATGGTLHLIGDYEINGNHSIGLGLIGGVGFKGEGTIDANGNSFGVFVDDHGALRGTTGVINATDNRGWSVFVRSGFMADVALNASNANNGNRAMLLILGSIVNLPAAQVTGFVACDGTELINGPISCGNN